MINKKSAINNFINIYGAATLIGILSLVVTWIFTPLINTAPILIFYLLAVIISAFKRGIKAGFLTLFITVAGSFYLFPPRYPFLLTEAAPYFVRLIAFIIVGTITCIIINRLINTKEVIKYKNREKKYLEIIKQIQNEEIKYKREIKARDEFLSIASHELKTPLTSMLLQIQTALNNIRNVSLANFSVAKLMKMLESTEHQSMRLSKMISDLLNVSLITTGRMDLEKTSFDLGKLTKDVVRRLSEKTKNGSSKIKVDVKSSVIGIWDPLRIEQLIINLVTNAIKYGAGNPIDIKVSKSGSLAKVTVIDHGIGIPAEQKDKIFEKFDRGGITNQDYRGLGVGLYISSQIVKAHKGTIKLSSKSGKGSTFTIELPIIKKPGKK